MSETVFFSIIIPTLNEENYLPKILSDLAKQKQKNFEVIVVDANSKDKTRENALNFSKEIPLKFYESKKANVSFQRNYGAKKATGKYLVFLDADARIDSFFTKNLYLDISKKRGEIFLPILISEENSTKNTVLFKLINSVIELSQSSNKPLSTGGAIFIEKELFEKLDGFREKLFMNEDHDLIQRAARISAKAKILKDIEVVFSLRRMKKEGEIMVSYKYLMALIYMLVNGKMSNKIFAYEMGGQGYKNVDFYKDRWNSIKDATKFDKLLRRTSEFLRDSRSKYLE